MSDFPTLSKAKLEALREFANRKLTAEEFNAYVNAPVSDEEREQQLELIRWFQRRYPTPEARLAYVRKAYARWAANRPFETRRP